MMIPLFFFWLLSSLRLMYGGYNYESQNVWCHLNLHKSQTHVCLHILLANVFLFLVTEAPFSRTIHVLSVHVAIISGLVWTAVNGLLDVSCPSKWWVFCKSFLFTFILLWCNILNISMNLWEKTVSQRLSDNIVSSSTNSMPLQIYFLECLFLIIQLRRQVFKSFFTAFGL